MEIQVPTYLFVYLALSAILSLFQQQTLADMPPIFRKEPSTEAVKQNSRVRIKCKVEPKDADVRWVFNGKDVVESEELGVSVRRGSLVIDAFTDGLHQGIYQCVASNSAGAVISREAFLQVAYIVNFPKTLPDRTYSLPGQIAVIDCQRPESLPPAQMEYFYNGALIVENDHYRILPSGRLHILHTTSDDEGVYGCRAINTVTSRSREQFNATMLELLEETSTMQDTPASVLFSSGALFQVGDQALLECVAVGIPYPNIRWQRSDAGALPEKAVQHLGSLKIPDVTMQDAGTYECLVDNGVGTPVMREVVLEVIELPAITKPPKSISVGVRGNAQFKCGVTGASEQNITWMHNAVPVPRDSAQYMVQEGTGGVQLLVMDITRAQLGVYQCIVRTKQGMDHAAAILKFREGFPRITGPPVNTTAIEGESVTMLCGASGDPLPDIRWFAPNGLPVVNGWRITLSKPSGGMTLKNVGPSDAGWYRCSASNSLGAVNSNVYLAVIEKLVVTPTPLQPSRKTIGKPLSSDDGNMTVENTEEPEKPGAVPDAPDKPEVYKTSDISVEVRWTHTDTTNTPLTRFTVEYFNIRVNTNWLVASSAIDPSNLSYEVNNLSPGGTYRFRVIAGNQYGDSAPSLMSHRFFLQPSTATERPVRPPTGEVRITSSKAVSSSAIQVVWEYTPDVRFNTPIDGFYIYHRDTDSDDDRDYIRTPVVGSTATRYLIDKLEREVSYDIKMSSFNSGGTSGFSNVVIVATPAPETPITFIPGPVIPSPDTVPNDLGGSLPDDVLGPEQNSPSTGTNQDILYITLGVVLGAMLLVLIMFGVMCIWRAKQVNQERTERWRHGPGPYYDGSTYRYIDGNGSSSHYKFHTMNGGMNGGPHQPPNHVYTQGIGHLPFGETATAIDPQPLYPLSQNGIEEHSLMLTSQPSISNGHGPYTSNGQIDRPYVPNGQVQRTVPMLPRTSSEPARSGFSPARSREGPLHSGSSSEHLHNGNGSLRSYNSNSGPDAGTTSSRDSGRSRSRRPKCPHRHPHKTDVNRTVRRQPNEHPTSREGSIGSSLDCASVEVSPPPTPTSSTAPSTIATVPPPRSDGMDSPHSRSRSSSNLSDASSSCRNVKHSDIF